MDDFDELLRRAMEAETREDFAKDGQITEEDFEKMFERVSAYGMIQVGSKSREKMREAVIKLQNELKNIDVEKDSASLAKAVSTIRLTAREIEVLHTIMTSASLSMMAMHSGKDVGSAIDTAVRLISF